MWIKFAILCSCAAIATCFQETAPAPIIAGNASDVIRPSVTAPIVANSTHAIDTSPANTTKSQITVRNHTSSMDATVATVASNNTSVKSDKTVHIMEQNGTTEGKASNVDLTNRTSVGTAEIGYNDLQPEAVASVQGTGVRTAHASPLHSSLEDLLNSDRQRVSRYKRDSNYENLMALLNFLEENGIDLSENSDSNNLHEYYKVGNDDDRRDLLQDYENPYDSELYYKPEDLFEAADDDENVIDVKEPNILQIPKGSGLLPELYRRRQPQLFMNTERAANAELSGRRPGYMLRNPYQFITESRPKRFPMTDSRSFGRWGNFMKRNRQSYERSGEKGRNRNRIYSLASMLVDRNSPELLKDRQRALAYM